MIKMSLVALGGAFGSVARYLLSGYVQQLTPSAFQPTGTLVVNLVGCLAIGVLTGLASGRLSGNARLLLVVGVCGGFTTFSTFGYETMQLLRDNEIWWATVNVAAQVVGGLVAVWAGLTVARVL